MDDLLEEEEEEEPTGRDKAAADAGDKEEIEVAEELESSLDELLARRVDAGEDEEESLLDLSPEERMETLNIRPTPPQANEFVCSKCHLVKNQSQLADRRRRLCRDCV